MSQVRSQRPTSRALFGTMGLVAFILAYILAAAAVAVVVLPRAGPVLEFVYYAAAGLAWVPGAILILKWMYPARAASRDRD